VRVGLDLVFLVPGETGGMEVYARQLVPRLAAAGLDVTAFVSTAARSVDLGVETVVLPVDARDRRQWVLGEQLHLPRSARRRRLDLVHALASTAPLHGPFRRVTTIHDLHYAIVPDAHFGARGLGMRILVPAAARRSHRIVAVSQQTADDLVGLLRVPAAKVDVVPNGVTPRPAVAPVAEAVLRERLGLGDRPVLLSASAKRPHKNLLRLLDAHARLGPDRPVLVLPGYPTPHEDELRARAAGLGTAQDVRFPAWVDDAELEGLYALATAFVFPSLYEGFGLPVLEAMARGVPVATSGRGALAEVAGGAAERFDAEDPTSIAAALRRVLSDAALRERLRVAGREQAARFTWERTAQGTLRAYERALE